MYEYLTGQVVDRFPSYIVLDVQGVGYRLLVGNPYAFAEKQAMTVYVQQIIRENDQSLYGFQTADEKRMFNQLLSVTGIGPKSALAILANGDQQTLSNAIAEENINFLTKFPGIGKKTASQIVLDLKNKVEQPSLLDEPTSDVPTALADALAALSALGYSDREVAKVEKALLKEAALSTDEYLRTGLRLLTTK
ncbi:Holliday junction branch migration protein RuvA [Lacticaseibacillus saniviri]|uniref:Holliday junction branch migration complex subunit RuvA n=1 Tax=Lacticaseibacillus saniviri JCM 17471 = DSM 24301 TaxID=1293598 RepID=A0A0R2MYK4_9LACO|nr:Holliday junction branch migration protein RuvA [Lacticaseibacillus saniviri]KRO17980.1 holliday junction atp-dependent dna helicase ruva [Lacticaseibacillus saniviri JCM 17471 = DSM 24301]MCG4281985.1 Holliday junction branch migration protein RuvA [Lacticaseibacillus saniviri]